MLRSCQIATAKSERWTGDSVIENWCALGSMKGKSRSLNLIFFDGWMLHLSRDTDGRDYGERLSKSPSPTS